MPLLQKMQWSKMLSYGSNNELDFTSATVSQILGKNGYGKSAIPHILEELLYNKNSKGYKKADIPNRYLDGKTYSGAVYFEKDGDNYVLTVNRSGATQKVILTKNGKDISQHTPTGTYEIVEKLFGKEFKLFSQLIYQNSRSSLQFLTATDTIRKKFLIDLLNLDKYLEIYEIFKNVSRDVSMELSRISGEVQGLESWLISSTDKPLDTINLIEVPKIPKELEVDHALTLSLLENIARENAIIEKNNQYKKLRNDIPSEHLTADIEKLDSAKLIAERATLEHIVDTNRKLLDKLKLLDDSCPTCLQKVDKEFIIKTVDEATKNIEDNKYRLACIVQELDEIKVHNKKYETNAKAIADFEKYSGLIDDNINELIHDKNIVESKLNDLTAKLNDIRSQIKKAKLFNDNAKTNNAKVELIKEQLESTTNKINTLKDNIKELTKTIGHLEILKKSFSTNGLVAYKLEYSVKELETLTNKYLIDLSDGRFQLLYSVLNDKLNITVNDSGKNVEIEALSSGELARVTTATLLAIRSLLNSLSKDSINVLFLDEVIDVLDEDGKDRLIEVLMKETDLNTFIVSHGYTHPLLNKIRVEKVDKISKIIYD